MSSNEFEIRRMLSFRILLPVLLGALLVLTTVSVGLTYDPLDYGYDDGEMDDMEEEVVPKPRVVHNEIRGKNQFGLKLLERLLWPFVREYGLVLDSLAGDAKSGLANTNCGAALKSIADGVRKRKLSAFRCKWRSFSRGKKGFDANWFLNHLQFLSFPQRP